MNPSHLTRPRRLPLVHLDGVSPYVGLQLCHLRATTNRQEYTDVDDRWELHECLLKRGLITVLKPQ